MLPGSRLTLLLPLLIPVSLGAQEPAAPTDSVPLAETDTDLTASIPVCRAWLEILDNAEYEESWKAAAPVSLARQADGSWRVVGYFVRPL